MKKKCNFYFHFKQLSKSLVLVDGLAKKRERNPHFAPSNQFQVWNEYFSPKRLKCPFQPMLSNKSMFESVELKRAKTWLICHQSLQLHLNQLHSVLPFDQQQPLVKYLTQLLNVFLCDCVTSKHWILSDFSQNYFSACSVRYPAQDRWTQSQRFQVQIKLFFL